MRESKAVYPPTDEKLESDETDRDGFYHFEISPSGEAADKSGCYTWNSEAGVYVNDNGHSIPPEKAPESEFEYNIDHDWQA